MDHLTAVSEATIHKDLLSNSTHSQHNAQPWITRPLRNCICAVDYLLLHICVGTILSTIREPRVFSFSTSQTNFLLPILLEKPSVSSSSLLSSLWHMYHVNLSLQTNTLIFRQDACYVLCYVRKCCQDVSCFGSTLSRCPIFRQDTCYVLFCVPKCCQDVSSFGSTLSRYPTFQQDTCYVLCYVTKCCQGVSSFGSTLSRWPIVRQDTCYVL